MWHLLIYHYSSVVFLKNINEELIYLPSLIYYYLSEFTWGILLAYINNFQFYHGSKDTI